MKPVFLVCVCLLAGTTFIRAQSLKKYDLGDSGFQAYLFDNPQCDKDTETEGALVWNCFCEKKEVLYSIVIFKGDPVLDSLKRANYLEGFTDMMKESYGITGAVGYGKGRTPESGRKIEGLIDFWSDEEGNEYVIHSWINPSYYVFMAIQAQGRKVEYNEYHLFFEGIRFPVE